MHGNSQTFHQRVMGLRSVFYPTSFVGCIAYRTKHPYTLCLYVMTHNHCPAPYTGGRIVSTHKCGHDHSGCVLPGQRAIIRPVARLPHEASPNGALPPRPISADPGRIGKHEVPFHRLSNTTTRPNTHQAFRPFLPHRPPFRPLGRFGGLPDLALSLLLLQFLQICSSPLRPARSRFGLPDRASDGPILTFKGGFRVVGHTPC